MKWCGKMMKSIATQLIFVVCLLNAPHTARAGWWDDVKNKLEEGVDKVKEAATDAANTVEESINKGVDKGTTAVERYFDPNNPAMVEAAKNLTALAKRTKFLLDNSVCTGDKVRSMTPNVSAIVATANLPSNAVIDPFKDKVVYYIQDYINGKLQSFRECEEAAAGVCTTVTNAVETFSHNVEYAGSLTDAQKVAYKTACTKESLEQSSKSLIESLECVKSLVVDAIDAKIPLVPRSTIEGYVSPAFDPFEKYIWSFEAECNEHQALIETFPSTADGVTSGTTTTTASLTTLGTLTTLMTLASY